MKISGRKRIVIENRIVEFRKYLGLSQHRLGKRVVLTRNALVLRGYNSNKYSVWNLWDAYYVTMSISAKSIAVSGDSFVLEVTIYGW